ncbi:hypothetical protein U1Q18_006403 [Sarracenia purpurea var. burkii]
MATMAEEPIKKGIEQMASKKNGSFKKEYFNRGAWTDEEDRKLAEVIAIHGAKKWKIIAATAGRTDNEIKNYWNSYLSKKIDQVENRSSEDSRREESRIKRRRRVLIEKANEEVKGEEDRSCKNGRRDSIVNFDQDDFFDFSNESPLTLQWINKFLELDNNFCELS